MKKLFLLLLLSPLLTHAQKAVIHFDINNTSQKKIYISNGDYTNPLVLFRGGFSDLPLVDRKASYSDTLSKPVFMTVYFQPDSMVQQPSQYVFYLSPGDSLNFSVDAVSPETSVAVTGKGSSNNQPAIQQLITSYYLELKVHKKDSLPGPVFKTIKKQAALNQQVLQMYITAHKPSKEFINTFMLFVQYYPTWAYIRFKGNQKFTVRKAYYRNKAQWEAIEDSLVRARPLSKPEVMDIPTRHYRAIGMNADMIDGSMATPLSTLMWQ